MIIQALNILISLNYLLINLITLSKFWSRGSNTTKGDVELY